MKEFALIVIGASSVLVAVESLHIYQHSDYCKSKSEWIKTYPPEIRRQLRPD